MNEDDFSWKDQQSVVFKSTQGIAVYFNPDNDVVIRQQAGPLDQEDVFLVLPSDKVGTLILALQNLRA